MPVPSRNRIGGAVVVLLLLLAVPVREAIRDTWPRETAAERAWRAHETEGAAELQRAVWLWRTDPAEVAVRRRTSSLVRILKRHPGTEAAEIAILILCPAGECGSTELHRMIYGPRRLVVDGVLSTAEEQAAWNAEWERHWKAFVAETRSRLTEMR